MMSFEQLAMMTRGGAIGLLIFAIIILFRDHRHTSAGRIAIVFLLSVIGHLIATIRYDGMWGNLFEWVVEVASNAAPGLFWIFARAWFRDEKPSWRSWLIVLLSVVLMQIHSFILYRDMESWIVPTAIAARLMGVALVIAGLYVAWVDRGNDLVEERRRVRSYGIALIGAYTILVLIVELGMRPGGLFLPEHLRFGLNLGIFLLILAAAYSIFSTNRTDLFGPPTEEPKPEDQQNDTIDEALAGKLTTYMQSELAWRNEGLGIADLAHALDVKEYRLRKLINQQLGYRNFATFLNGYRLEEVKKALADPDEAEVPILTMALDAGFGSLGPFNRAFRDAEGMTPTQYRHAHLSSKALS